MNTSRGHRAEPPPRPRNARWLAMCPETRALHQMLSTPQPEGCLPMHGRACNVAKRPEQLEEGGCWRLSGTHRLSAPLLLRCPTQIVGDAGAVLSGGRPLPPLRQRGQRLWVSGPTGSLQRQLFASGAAAERGPLVRLPIASLRPRRFGGSVSTTAEGFVGALALCDLLLRAVDDGIEVRPIAPMSPITSDPSDSAPIASYQVDESLRLEAVYLGKPWNQPRCAISNVTRRGGRCVLIAAQPCHRHVAGNATTAASVRQGTLVRIDNAPSGLNDAEHAWAQLSDGRVLLRWPAGEPLPASLLAPVSDGLIVATELRMSGVRLVLSGWAAPAKHDSCGSSPDCHLGFAETQAGFYVPGLVRTSDVAKRGRVCPIGPALLAAAGEVHGSSFAALGGNGLHLLSGSAHANVFDGISGGGLLLGTPRLTRGGGAASANATCNAIRSTGLEYPGSTGLWGGYLSGASITSNRVSEVSYTAISIGWGWTGYPSCDVAGTARKLTRGGGMRTGGGADGGGRRIVGGVAAQCSMARGNRIEHNVVRNHMRTITCDGAALYTLGPQPGTTIAHNCVARDTELALHPVPPWQQRQQQGRQLLQSQRRSAARKKPLVTVDPAWAVYLDDGSEGITATNNTVTAGQMLTLKGTGRHVSVHGSWPVLMCDERSWRRIEGDTPICQTMKWAATRPSTAAGAASGVGRANACSASRPRKGELKCHRPKSEPTLVPAERRCKLSRRTSKVAASSLPSRCRASTACSAKQLRGDDHDDDTRGREQIVSSRKAATCPQLPLSWEEEGAGDSELVQLARSILAEALQPNMTLVKRMAMLSVPVSKGDVVHKAGGTRSRLLQRCFAWSLGAPWTRWLGDRTELV